MKIKIADKSGFCFGVARAVKIAEDSLKIGGEIYTLGKLIHNKTVIDSLLRRGVKILENPCDAPSGAKVVIRAHGISESDEKNLLNAGAEVIDATCPYVKKIHNIVRKESKSGRFIIVVGDASHPEVIGISGRTGGNCEVISDETDIMSVFEKYGDIPVSVVAQTTIRHDLFEKIAKSLKKHFTNAEFFDTICSATSERQKCAASMAKNSDVMFVIGGRDSSNTKKLYEICKMYCARTFAAENAEDVKQYINQIHKNFNVGITAGASTPEAVIKEVYLTMAENNEMNFAEALEETLKPLNSGEIVKGVVRGTTPTEVQVDIGGKYDGIIPFNELTDDPTANIDDLVKVGQEVDVYVVHVSDRDGVVTLSKKKIDAAKGLEELKTAFENNEILTGRVVEIVKGGVVTLAHGVRVFIPASECAERFLPDLGILLNTEQSFRIIKMGEDRRGRRGQQRVVGSIKSVVKEQREKAAESFWATAEVGKKYTGTVKSLTSFGAFVDLGGVDGLIHVSELSPIRIDKPSDVVSVGDEMEVYIKELSKENNRISLVKELKEVKAAEFWKTAEVGKKYTGIVKSLTPFGAFVDLGGVDGLVHISELSWNRIKHPSEVVNVGDELDVYIKSIDRDNEKISLGYKKEEDSPWVKATKDLKVGDQIKCKIVRILPFGAFAEIAPYVDGLIHISQISNIRIDKPSDVLAIGDVVDAAVVEINDDTKQIGLSMKALMDDSDENVSSSSKDREPMSYSDEGSFTLGDILDTVETAESSEEEAVAEDAKSEKAAESDVE